MGNSLAKVYFPIVLIIVLSKTVHSQTESPHSGTITTIECSGYKKTTARIKWTWQLPASVKNAFYETQYKDWFIENMAIYENSGKTFIGFA